jgi:16S rRNA A1518/A1519 N6-dimethyltransferase RsmA/KsgA/DIM1 with predicted DNA glycosylase/AP lyase activity
VTELAIIGLVIFGIFAFVVLRGAPYLPTLKPQIKEALELLELKNGQTLLELGSGDGRLLRAAAEQGIYSVGYELNPLLVIWTKLRHWRYRQYISVKWGDYWNAEWPETDGMYVFLLQKYMDKLDKKVVQYAKNKPYRLVSFGFEIKSRKPAKKSHGLTLYEYK